MHQLCVRRDMKHLGRLKSTQEARVALAWLRLEQLLHIFRALQTSCVLHISMNTYSRMKQLLNNVWVHQSN